MSMQSNGMSMNLNVKPIMPDIVINTGPIHGIDTVAIDEKAGRRLARIHGLKVTGSLGILLKARRHSLIPSIGECIALMRDHGIWISAELMDEALRRANEG